MTQRSTQLRHELDEARRSLNKMDRTTKISKPPFRKSNFTENIEKFKADLQVAERNANQCRDMEEELNHLLSATTIEDYENEINMENLSIIETTPF